MTQENNMTIKLNTGAMNALFPEGTPARVELQQAVIQNFFDRALKIKMVDNITGRLAEVERKTKEYMDEALLEQLGLKKTGYYGNTWEFKPETKTILAQQVRTISTPLVDEAVRNATVDIQKSIKSQLANLDIEAIVSRMVTAEAIAEIRKQLVAKLA